MIPSQAPHCLWRKILSGLAAVLLLLLMGLATIPFILSMSPTDHDVIANDQRTIWLDLKHMESNKLYRFGMQPMEQRFPSYIYLYRRTLEQMHHLSDDPPFRINEERWLREDPPGTRNRFRSLRPELFVFSVEVAGPYLRPSRVYIMDWIPDCSSLLPDQMDQHRLATFFGGIVFPYCGDRSFPPFFVYDLAGNAAVPSMDPLTIPPHFYDENGRLVIGRQTTETIAHRFLTWFDAPRGASGI